MDSGSGWLELSLAPIVLAVTTSRSDGPLGRPDRFGFPDRYVASAFACLLACLLPLVFRVRNLLPEDETKLA